MFPPYVWHFTARATEPVTAIFFHGTILREDCERDHSLGYELFKRMGAVMTKRLQAARAKMLAIHSHETELSPVGPGIGHVSRGRRRRVNSPICGEEKLCALVNPSSAQ
jgi:hypothetical protein